MTNLTKAAQRVLLNAKTFEIPPRRELIKHSDVIYRLVRESRWTVDELSAIIGIPSRTIREYMWGNRSPTLPKARKLLGALNADLDVFQVRVLPVLAHDFRRGSVATPSTDPILRDLLDIKCELHMSNAEMFRRTGKRVRDSLSKWVSGEIDPTLSSLDTCFAAVGYELRIVE